LKEYFVFRGKQYKYFIHPYNTTWANERKVELPLAIEVTNEYNENEILEIGNTLKHYIPLFHTVIDKYEHGDGVINEDVTTFHLNRKFALIISISTLEHIGNPITDPQEEFEPYKILKAIENLKRHLQKDGKIWITLPKGQNPYVDEVISDDRLRFDEMYCLKRNKETDDWTETTWNDIKNYTLQGPYFHGADALIIGIIFGEEKRINV